MRYLARTIPLRRERPNLTIRPHCLVDRVLLDDRGAVGLEVEAGGERARVYGRRITLAAGAIGSPAILLRSGIGPEDALVELGIEPAVDLHALFAELAAKPDPAFLADRTRYV